MKKAVILSMAVTVGMTGLAPLGGQVAYATEQVPMRANELVTDLYFDKIGGSAGTLGYEYNWTQRHDIRLAESYIATYKYEEYTTAMVEERLGELGTDKVVDPEWAETVMMSNIGVDYAAMGGTTLWVGSWFINNRPGVLYYALKTYEIENPDTPVWYRGKIDYRACVRDTETGQNYDCEGRLAADGQTMEFVREGTEETGLEGAKTWGEEWQEDLANRLAGIAGEVTYWDGNAAQKENWAQRIANVKMLASDAKEPEMITAKITEIETAVEKKEWDLAHPEGEEGKNEGMGSGTGAGGSSSGANGSGNESGNDGTGSGAGSLGAGASGSQDEPDNGGGMVPVPPRDKNPVKTEVEIKNNQGQVANVAKKVTSTQLPQVVAKNDMAEKDRVDVEQDGDDDELGLNIYDEEVEVPNLNDESEQGGWWLWWVIILVLGLGAAVCWWLKRAFGKKQSSN